MIGSPKVPRRSGSFFSAGATISENFQNSGLRFEKLQLNHVRRTGIASPGGFSELPLTAGDVPRILRRISVKSITVTELADILRGISRSNLLSLTAITDPDMTLRNNPFCTKDGRAWKPHVRKVSFLTGALINVSYSRMVNARRLKEYAEQLRPQGDLPVREHNPRAWGKHETDGPLVAHTVGEDARLYLHVVVQRRWDHFFDSRTDRKIRGDDFVDLHPWLNERDAGYKAQRLRSPVVVKDFTLTNLAEITANKIRYTIAPANAELDRYFPGTKPAAPVRRRVPSSPTRAKQRSGGRS